MATLQISVPMRLGEKDRVGLAMSGRRMEAVRDAWLPWASRDREGTGTW